MQNERVVEALDNLRVHQRQLDADGVMVGVSREALNEVILAFGREQRRASVPVTSRDLLHAVLSMPHEITGSEIILRAAQHKIGNATAQLHAALTAALSVVSHETGERYTAEDGLRRAREIALQSEAAPLSMGEIVKVADTALGETTSLPGWMTAPTDETQEVKREKWEERFWKMDANFDRSQTRAETAKASLAAMREALTYAGKGLGMVHDGLMDPTRPRQAVGEVCSHFLDAARTALAGENGR